MRSAVRTLDRAERVEPVDKAVRLAGLEPDPSPSAKAASEALAGEEERLVAADPGDRVGQPLGEGDDVSRVDNEIVLFGIERDHRAEGIKPEMSVARTFYEKERFTREESLRYSLPLRFDRDRGTRGDEARILDEDRFTV